MPPDPLGTRRAAPRLRRGFSPPASRSLPGPPGNPPAAAKAPPWFPPDPAPPAPLLAPPNNATPPRSATLQPRISRPIVFGRHREGTALLPAAESPEWASPSPAVPAILPATLVPSIVLHSRRHQPRRKVLPHTLQPRLFSPTKNFLSIYSF